MKKKIMIILAAAIGMSCLLGMFNFLLDSWMERSTLRKVIGLLALFGWAGITYNMITLKYKWIKKLTE